MSEALVIDCSVSASWVLPDEHTPVAETLLRRVLEGDCSLIQPDLWWIETLNLLRTAVLRKRLTESGARKALYFLKEIPLETVGVSRESEFLVLDRALCHGLTAYDATYLVLAEMRGAELVTADRDLLALQSDYSFIHPLA